MEEDFRLQTSKSPTTITFSGYKKPTDRLTLMVVLSLQVAFTSKEISSSLFACGSLAFDDEQKFSHSFDRRQLP
jgi:hypothetical protein